MSGVSLNSETFKSVSAIDTTSMALANPDRSLYFTISFLESFEKHHPDITFTYLLIKDGQNRALVILQSFTVDLENATTHLKLGKTLARALPCSLNATVATLQLCGNVFLSGAYGITASSSEFLKEAYAFVAARMKRKNATSFSFFKDFSNLKEVGGDQMEALNFLPFQVEPNMLLHIHSDWTDFENYKNALRSKYRVKINRADVMSASLTTRNFTEKDILIHLNSLQELLSQVVNHADFKSIIFNVATYAVWKRHLGDRFTLTGYFLREQLVGFSTALHDHDQLDAHYIGLDYSLHKENAIYPRILNDYVRQAIQLKCKVLNLGRTSSEIKSTLGAIPQPLVCYMRHKRSLANRIIKPLTKNMSATDFKMHKPLKQ